MKALIISEDQTVCDSLNKVLVEAGYDTIIYKWLLKALDNVEEIRPDCVVVSSSEYPRHWKTLVQFIKSGIGGENVQIYLYEPNPMSSEDIEKARILGINGYFNSLDDEILSKIFKKINDQKEEVSAPVEENAAVEESESVDDSEPLEESAPVAESEPVDEPEQQEIPTVNTIISEESKDEPVETVNNSGYFMFTQPQTNKYVAGRFFDYNGSTLSCTFANNADLENISGGLEIDSFTFFDEKTTRNARVFVKEIVKLSESNTFVIMEIAEIYEEV